MISKKKKKNVMMSRSKEGSEKLDSWFDSDRYLDFFDGFDVDDYITMRTRSRNNVLTLSSPVATGPRSNGELFDFVEQLV